MFKSAVALLLIIAFAQCSNLRVAHFDNDNVKDFVFGVLLANRFMEKVPDVYNCVADSTELQEAI